jgi:hypothetical protein
VMEHRPAAGGVFARGADARPDQGGLPTAIKRRVVIIPGA